MAGLSRRTLSLLTIATLYEENTTVSHFHPCVEQRATYRVSLSDMVSDIGDQTVHAGSVYKRGSKKARKKNHKKESKQEPQLEKRQRQHWKHSSDRTTGHESRKKQEGWKRCFWAYFFYIISVQWATIRLFCLRHTHPIICMRSDWLLRAIPAQH